MERKLKSLLSNEPVCYICGTPYNLHRHHIIYGSGRRQLSEKYGLWVYLCGDHHNLSPYGVHNDRELDTRLKQEAQTAWEAKYGTREDFIKVFGRSWL